MTKATRAPHRVSGMGGMDASAVISGVTGSGSGAWRGWRQGRLKP